MSKESHGAEPREGAQIVEEETVIESPSRQDAAPGVDPILLGGSASVPVKEEVSMEGEERAQEEARPTAQAQSHGAVQEQEQAEVRPTAQAQRQVALQEQEQREVRPTAQAQSHGAVAQQQPKGAAPRVAVLPGAQPVKREPGSTGNSSADQAQSHELDRQRSRTGSADDISRPTFHEAMFAQLMVELGDQQQREAARLNHALRVEGRNRDRFWAGIMPERMRLEQERLEQERLARLEQQRLERERLDQDRLEQGHLEEMAAEEAMQQEPLVQNRLEQEPLEQEPLEQRMERELRLIELVVDRADRDRLRVQQDDELAQQELRELMADAERRTRPDPRRLRASAPRGLDN